MIGWKLDQSGRILVFKIILGTREEQSYEDVLSLQKVFGGCNRK